MLNKKACLACAERYLRNEDVPTKNIEKSLAEYSGLWALGTCMCTMLFEESRELEKKRRIEYSEISVDDNPPEGCPYVLEHAVL